MSHDWTTEDAARAQKYWNEGYSASQIASLLNLGLTRNAVIGKLSRMGCSRRGGPGTSQPFRNPKPRARRRTPFRELAVEAIPIPIIEVFPAEAAKPVTLLELEPHHCRWPIGDPRSPDFRFCGAHYNSKSSYCEPHDRASRNSARAPITPEQRGEHARQERKAFGVAFR